MSILVVTNRENSTADYLIQHFQRVGATHHRIDTDYFPDTTIEFTTRATRIHGTLRTMGWEIPFDAIWWRRPASPALPWGLTEAEGDFVVNEIEAGSVA